MKTWFLLLALMLPLAARAGERLRLEPEAAWALAFLAPAALAEEVAHEGSHATVGTAMGLHVISFEPWPQSYQGRWLWAGMEFREKDGGWTRAQRFWVNAAPAVMDLTILAVTTAVLFCWRTAPAWALGAIIAIRCAAMADLTTFALGWSRRVRYSDGGDTRRAIFGW